MSRGLRGLLALALAFCWLLAAPASATGLLPELDTSSPAATLRSFHAEQARVESLLLAYREAPTTARQLALAEAMARIGRQLFDLRLVPPVARDKAGGAAAGQLTDIVSRLPPIEPASIPGDPAWRGVSLPTHWTIPGTELRIVRLADGPRAGDYVFSAETVASLPAFHARIADAPVLRPGAVGDWVPLQRQITGPWLAPLGLEGLPAPLQATLLDTPVWKILLSLAVALGILAALLGWRRFVRRRETGLAPWRRRALRLSVPALLAALVAAGHIFIVWQVVPSSSFAVATTLLAVAFVYVAAAWAAWCACWLLAEIVIASPSFPDGTYDAHLVRIVARVASLLAVAFILLFGANDVGVPALGLLAGVSIGGVALALAAQSMAANLLGGIVIFADRAFRVGEVIRYGANTGTVEAIGPRSTRVRGPDGTLTTVPNADLANTQLVNVSARASSLFSHRISLPAALSSDGVEALLADLRQRVARHPLVETAPGLPRVRLVALGASAGAMEAEIVALLRTTATAEFLAAQEELLLDILRGVEALRPAARAGMVEG